MSKVTKLKQKSANILSVFSKTVINLETVNKEITREQIVRKKAEQALMDAAAAERKAGIDLQTQFDSNANVAKKISAFLND